jgi:hypothetical protein
MGIADFKFSCEEYRHTENGDIQHYLLKIDHANNETLIIPIKPNEIASHTSMKKILMGYKIFYSPTKSEHNKILTDMFKEPLKAIQ